MKSRDGALSIYDSVFGISDFGTSQFQSPDANRLFVDNYGTKTYGKRRKFSTTTDSSDKVNPQVHLSVFANVAAMIDGRSGYLNWPTSTPWVVF